MNSEVISSRYAKALLEYAAEAGSGNKVYSQALALAHAMQEVPMLRDIILKHDDVALVKKTDLLSTALGEPLADELVKTLLGDTSAMYAENFLTDIDKLKNLKQVTIVGCCTDICVLNLAIPLNNYFNQKNRNIEIIVPKNAVETFDSEMHKRYEYNEIAFKLMAQAGIKLV